MKKTLFLSLFLFSSSYFFGGDSSFNCDPKKFLAEDVLEKVLVHRDSAFNICLDCEDQSCQFKDALLSDEKSLSICKRLFCTASFASRGFEIPPETPRGKSLFSYKYSISTEGKVKNIKVESTEGVFSSRDAREFIKALTRKTKYVPIEFEGNYYELTDLKSEMSINTRLGND